MDRSLYSDNGSQLSVNNMSDFSIMFEGLSDKHSQQDPQDFEDEKIYNNNNFVYGESDATAAQFFNKLIASDQQRSKSVSNNHKLKITDFQKEFKKAFNNGNILKIIYF